MMKSIWGIVKLFGFATGVLSLILLIRLAVVIDVVAPLRLIADYYEAAISFVFSWTDPYITIIAETLSERFDYAVMIGPHWKHIFIIMWLYFAADLRANWALGRFSFGVFSVMWGLTVALLSSLSAGAFDPGRASGDLQLLTIPAAGLVIFELGRSLWSTAFYVASPSFDPAGKSRIQVFRYCFVTFVFPVAAIGAAAVFLLPNVVRNFSAVESVGLACLFAYVLALSAYWAMRGAWLGFFDRHDDENWISRFARSGSTRLASAVLATLIGAFIYFGLNAGLQLVGL